MKIARGISLALLIQVSPVLYAQEEIPRTAFVGIVHDGNKYDFTANFGIEQWEDGKRTTHRYQTWYLGCSPNRFGGNIPFNMWCSLERTVIDNGFTKEPTKHISIHKHYIEENTFRLTNFNGPEGKLDFSIVLADKNTIEVAIRFKRWRNNLYLESFKAIGIARSVLSDSLSAVEYKVPEYSYILNAPIEMRGLKDQDQKRLDDFEKSLSEKDREIWKSNVSRIWGSVDQVDLKTVIPDIDKVDKGARKLTAVEAQKVADSMVSPPLLWVDRSAMSADGKEKAKTFINKVRAQMLDGLMEDIGKD